MKNIDFQLNKVKFELKELFSFTILLSVDYKLSHVKTIEFKILAQSLQYFRNNLFLSKLRLKSI